MRTKLKLIASTLLLGALFFFAGIPAATEKGKNDPQFIYTCNCGKKCDCNAIAVNPGTCPCGKKLKENNIIQLDGDQVIFCDCGGGCVCSLSDTDPGSCSCGVPLDEVTLKGLYACACGPGCDCNTLSDQPGKCACGKELRKIE